MFIDNFHKRFMQLGTLGQIEVIVYLFKLLTSSHQATRSQNSEEFQKSELNLN